MQTENKPSLDSTNIPITDTYRFKYLSYNSAYRVTAVVL